MTTIKLVADDQSLEVAQNPVITSGEENTVVLHVDFSSDWNGFGKTAVFFTERNKTTLYEKVMTSGECIVPSEVMVNEGTFLVGVRGVNSSNKQVKTTSLVKYKISQGTPAVVEFGPTPDVYEQLLGAYGLLNSKVDNLATLPEGSTTGDAELIDIRVKADGTTATSAGNAVREQVSELKSDIDELTDITIGSYQKIDNELYTIVGLLQGDTGNVDTQYANYRSTDFIEIPKLAIGFYGRGILYQYCSCFIIYNENREVINWFHGDYDIDLSDPFLSGAKYFRASIDTNSLSDHYCYIRYTKNNVVGLIEKINKIPNTYIVDKDGNGTHNSLSACILEACEKENSIVYVNKGTYNIYDEFTEIYGQTFWDNPYPNEGLILKNRVHLIFSPDSEIVFNYDGSNEWVRKNFSPFNSGIYGFTMENANIICTNARYCVHDERWQNTDFYQNNYINCYMKMTNNYNEGYGQCIGGGLGLNGVISIENSVFENTNTEFDKLVTFHNSPLENAKSSISVKNSYFKNKGTYTTQYYGASTKVTTSKLCNNSFGKAPYIRQESESYSNVNVEIVMWNNEVRTN